MTSFSLTLDQELDSSDRGLQVNKAQVSKVKVKSDRPPPTKGVRPPCAPRPPRHPCGGGGGDAYPGQAQVSLHLYAPPLLPPLPTTLDALLCNHSDSSDQGVGLSPTAAAAESTARNSKVNEAPRSSVGVTDTWTRYSLGGRRKTAAHKSRERKAWRPPSITFASNFFLAILGMARDEPFARGRCRPRHGTVEAVLARHRVAGACGKERRPGGYHAGAPGAESRARAQFASRLELEPWRCGREPRPPQRPPRVEPARLAPQLEAAQCRPGEPRSRARGPPHLGWGRCPFQPAPPRPLARVA